MTTVNLHAAKTNFSRLVDAAAGGAEFVIAKAGKPMAKLVPLDKRARRKRRLGTLSNRVAIPEDFDAPLPDELIDVFHGR